MSAPSQADALPAAILISSSEAALFTTLITSNVLKSLKGSDSEKIKTSVSLVGALARCVGDPSLPGIDVNDYLVGLHRSRWARRPRISFLSSSRLPKPKMMSSAKELYRYVRRRPHSN